MSTQPVSILLEFIRIPQDLLLIMHDTFDMYIQMILPNLDIGSITVATIWYYKSKKKNNKNHSNNIKSGLEIKITYQQSFVNGCIFHIER